MNWIKKIISIFFRKTLKREKKLNEFNEINKNNKNMENFKQSLKLEENIVRKNKEIEVNISNGDGLGIQNKMCS